MQIYFSMHGKTLTVKIEGELDHHSAGQIKELLEKTIFNGGIKNLIFDFSRLTFMDSSAIGMIIGRYKLISSLGGTVSIVSNNRQLDKLIEMSGLKKIICVFKSEEEAIKNAQGGKANA